MRGQLFLAGIILIPVIGAFLLPIAGKIHESLRNLIAISLVAASLVLTALCVKPVLSGVEPFYFTLPASVAGLDMSFGLEADGLAVFMALVSSLIGAVIILYSFGYIKHYPNRNEYYMTVVLFIGAMMGIVFSINLIYLYTFWEISAVCCWRLIGFFRKDEHVIRAGKAFLVTAAGAVVMLLGFIVIYRQSGTFILTNMKGTVISNTAVVLILFGILSKSATLPLHTWLPDAGVAPSPVTALLHAAVLVKIGVYVFARLFIATFTIDTFWHTAVPVIAAVSALVSAGAALLENDIKRIVAYSTVSQIGFIFLGLSTGNKLAAAGGLLYILMHGLSKGGLFLCAGIVEHNAHTKDIRQMGGFISNMPVTAAAFIICAFSIMGIPPLGGFFSKYMVITGAINAGNLWISIAFILGAILTVIYLIRLFVEVFLGESKAAGPKEGSKTMVAGVVIMAALSLAAGLFIYYPFGFVEKIVNQMWVVVK